MPAEEEPEAVDLTADQVDVVQHFIVDHGTDGFDQAMHTGELFHDLRAISQFSLNTALAAQAAGLPCTLILQLRPKAARKGERIEIRLVMGETSQLVLDFPSAS